MTLGAPVAISSYINNVGDNTSWLERLTATLKKFAVPVTPSTAGGTTLGTTALPWSSVYVGAAATNNIQITGTATGARTFTLPDANSNPVQPNTGASNQFVTAISSAGVISLAQPAFTNLSGNINVNQMNSGTNASSATFWRGDGAWVTLAGTTTWDTIGSAGANLTLNNSTFTTEFDQTTNAVWLWKNTTIATSGTTNASPLLELAANYWTGAASSQDLWTIGSILAAGTNGIPTFVIDHPSGSSGAKAFSLLAGSGGGTINIQVGGRNVIAVAGSSNTSFLSDQTVSSSSVFITGSNNSNVAGAPAVTIRNINPYAGASGNSTVVQVPGTFNPTSGTLAFCAFEVKPTINQTSTASGSYTGLRVNAVETALLGTANLLLDLQAGATGGTSKFAVSNAGIISKYSAVATVASGVPSQVATVDLVNQSAAVTTTTLYAVPAAGAGLYRVTYYAKITTVGSSSTLGGVNGFQVTWTDPTDTTTPTATVADSLTQVLTGNTTTTADGGSVVISAKASTNIQYAFDYTSSGTAMQYKLSIRVEYLG